MEKDLQLTPADEITEHLPYRNLIGALLWIARASRPDIMYSVIYLSRFSNCYSQEHFKAAKRVLRFLITTIDKKLTFHQVPKGDTLKVVMYSDSDWASDKNDRRSFSGSVVFLNGCAISWHCSKQAKAVQHTEIELPSSERAAKGDKHALTQTQGVQYFFISLKGTVTIGDIKELHKAINEEKEMLAKRELQKQEIEAKFESIQKTHQFIIENYKKILSKVSDIERLLGT